jgi:hemerythrin superfamily protein
MFAWTSRLATRAAPARVLVAATLAGAAALIVRRLRGRRRVEGDDVVDLLLARHREADRLMEEYERAALPELRRSTLHALRRRLSIHEAVEEQLVHPLVRRQLPDGHRLVVEVLAQEHEAKELLATIEDRERRGDDPEEIVQRLFAGVRRHAQTEETLVFPQLRLHLGPRERMRLGAMVERAERLAPTRPHPHAPSAGPGVVGMPVVGVLDRARDRVRH